MYELKLTEYLRRRLKRPLGELVTGSESQIVRRLRELIQLSKPSRVIAVGDAVSRFISQHGLQVDVRIIDYHEMRKNARHYTHKAANIFNLRNQAGTIAPESWQIITQALSRGESLIVVEGEEDLLTLVAVSEAPIQSIVLYGQPYMGIVVVKVDTIKKKEIEEILGSMIREKL